MESVQDYRHTCQAAQCVEAWAHSLFFIEIRNNIGRIHPTSLLPVCLTWSMCKSLVFAVAVLCGLLLQAKYSALLSTGSANGKHTYALPFKWGGSPARKRLRHWTLFHQYGSGSSASQQGRPNHCLQSSSCNKKHVEWLDWESCAHSTSPKDVGYLTSLSSSWERKFWRDSTWTR